jgi:hypothetical protein
MPPTSNLVAGHDSSVRRSPSFSTRPLRGLAIEVVEHQTDQSRLNSSDSTSADITGDVASRRADKSASRFFFYRGARDALSFPDRETRSNLPPWMRPIERKFLRPHNPNYPVGDTVRDTSSQTFPIIDSRSPAFPAPTRIREGDGR